MKKYKIQEGTARLAAAEEISVGAALAAVISELNGIFTSEKKRRAELKAFLTGKRCCRMLYSGMTLARV